MAYGFCYQRNDYDPDLFLKFQSSVGSLDVACGFGTQVIHSLCSLLKTHAPSPRASIIFHTT